MNKTSGAPQSGMSHFLNFANEAGLQHYMQQDQLNKGFACASQLGKPLQRPKQLKMTIQQTVSSPGLYLPKHYSTAINTPATAWSPEEQPTSEEFSKIFHKTELKTRSYARTEAGKKSHT